MACPIAYYAADSYDDCVEVMMEDQSGRKSAALQRLQSCRNDKVQQAAVMYQLASDVVDAGILFLHCFDAFIIRSCLYRAFDLRQNVL